MATTPDHNLDWNEQNAFERLCSALLLRMLRSKLPPGWTLDRLVTKDDQLLGDYVLRCGAISVYIELKIENYPFSLFLEVIQFGRKDGRGWFAPSWAFTTTAQWMLYFSSKTGQLILAPRHAWLQTQIDVFDAALRATHSAKSPFRPACVLNSHRKTKNFTRGSAGAGQQISTLVQAHRESGRGFGDFKLTDAREILVQLRELAKAGDPRALADELREDCGTPAPAATLNDAWRELCYWNTKLRKIGPNDEVVTSFAQVLPGGRAHVQSPLSALISHMVHRGPALSSERTDLPKAMWLAACLDSGRLTGSPPEKAVEQAQMIAFAFDGNRLGMAVKPALARKSLRMAAWSEDTPAYMDWAELKDAFVECVEAKRDEARLAYWREHKRENPISRELALPPPKDASTKPT